MFRSRSLAASKKDKHKRKGKKVVAAVSGTEFIQFLAKLAIVR